MQGPYEYDVACWLMLDPIADMIVNRYKYFRWTPRTARITFIYMVVIPSIIGYVGYTTDVSALTMPYTNFFFPVNVNRIRYWHSIIFPMHRIIDRARTAHETTSLIYTSLTGEIQPQREDEG